MAHTSTLLNTTCVWSGYVVGKWRGGHELWPTCWQTDVAAVAILWLLVLVVYLRETRRPVR